MITTYYGVVQPWLCDTQGHLTTRHYVGMFDDSHMHFFAELGADLEEMLKRGEGFADVKSTLEYKEELHLGALIVIKGTLVSLGRKSFVHRHEMYNRGSGELAATMEKPMSNSKAVVVPITRSSISNMSPSTISSPGTARK